MFCRLRTDDLFSNSWASCDVIYFSEVHSKSKHSHRSEFKCSLNVYQTCAFSIICSLITS